MRFFSSSSSCCSGASRSDAVPVRPVSCRSSRFGIGVIGFLSWAAVLVLVSRFARPILVALTGRLLFSTMLLRRTSTPFDLCHLLLRSDQDHHDVAQRRCYRDRRRRPLHRLSTVLDASVGLNHRNTAGRSRGISGCWSPAHAAAEHILENLRLQQSTTRSSAPASISPSRYAHRTISRSFARVVLGDKDVLMTPPGRSGSWRCSSSSDRLREDRPDDGQPGGHPPARLDHRAVEAPERAAPSPTRTSSRSSPRSWCAAGGAYETFDPIPFAARRRRSVRPDSATGPSSVTSTSPPRTRVPSWSRASWTWAVDAAANGIGSKVWYSCFGGLPSSLVTIATTSSYAKGAASLWRVASSVIHSAGRCRPARHHLADLHVRRPQLLILAIRLSRRVIHLSFSPSTTRANHRRTRPIAVSARAMSRLVCSWRCRPAGAGGSR